MSTTTTVTPHPAGIRRFSRAALLRAFALALVASVAAVLAIRATVVNAVSVPSAFTPLMAGADVSLTILGTVGALLLAVVANRVATDPVATFKRVVPVALAISWVPDIVIWVADAYPGTRAATVLPLMLMHLVVAGIAYAALTAAREPEDAVRLDRSAR